MKIFQLFKLLAVCAVLCAGFVQSQGNCPGIGDENLEPSSDDTRRNDDQIMKMINSRGRSSANVDFVGNMENDKCIQPQEPSDDIPEKTTSSRAKRAILAVVMPRNKTCEPCPPRVHSLRRFYKNCYVIFSWIQNVRYVTCNKGCNKPCMCTHSYCQRTSYRKSWFLSYCFSNPPGAFVRGWNFRFLYLPQDCTCHQHHHGHKG